MFSYGSRQATALALAASMVFFAAAAPVMAVETATFVPERMLEVMNAQLLATDLADYLVRRGVPFRTTHEVVGRLVRKSEELRVSLSELPLDASNLCTSPSSVPT